MQVIYQSDTLKAVVNKGAPTGGPTRPALVTFEGRGVEQRRNQDQIFGAPLARKMGIDIVHVIPVGADWYQYADMGACMDALRPHLVPETLAYGSSMGGYAVARWADRLGVARGLCLSPQYSIQRSVVPFERRWSEFAERTRFLEDDTIAPRRANIWMFLDETLAPEVRHAELIGQSGPHEIINVPHGGHPVGPALLSGGVLQPILDAFVAGTESRAGFETLIAGARMDGAPQVMIRRLETIRGPARDALLDEMLVHYAEGPPNLRFTLGLMLLRQNRVAEAEAQMAPLLHGPGSRNRIERYRGICTRLGLPATLLD